VARPLTAYSGSYHCGGGDIYRQDRSGPRRALRLLDPPTARRDHAPLMIEIGKDVPTRLSLQHERGDPLFLRTMRPPHLPQDAQAADNYAVNAACLHDIDLAALRPALIEGSKV